MIAPRLLWVVFSDAWRSIVGVPDRRRSFFSGAERNTRRAVCAPVGSVM
jgi:hypothetical protein